MMGTRQALKRAMGGLPLTAELAQRLRPTADSPLEGGSLSRLAEALPGWVEAAARAPQPREAPDRVLVMGCLSWWLEHACALGLLLSAQGRTVDLAFVPYPRWMREVEPFDLRRQRVYLRSVLAPLRGRIELHDLSARPVTRLPEALDRQIAALAMIDVQYSVRREHLDLGHATTDRRLLEMRLRRDREAASRTLRLLAGRKYASVVIPNGSILEFGAVYRTARFLSVPVITYEFGEQRERMWLARDDEVMRLDTTALWEARGRVPLTESEQARLQTLMDARRGARRWGNFARRWQAEESQGAQAARRELGLDPAKPMVLLCTNVVGDSLALGRQVFTEGMADWLALSVRLLAARPEVQLVVRVHPGELLGAGHPSVEIVRTALPELPANVVVVPPESRVNTYDLVELASLGLTYTTTVGLEMAMRGLPVVVSGRTHYRAKGFTFDPGSPEEYRSILERVLGDPGGHALSPEQVELAWRYAYRFFFEYPFPFPWHLIGFWDDIAARPMRQVLEPEHRARYRRTLDALAGMPIEWTGEA